MLLSSQLDKIIHKHSISHALSGGAVAGLITVLGSAGTATAEASVVGAPETGGTSLAGLIPAGLLIGTSALLGFITGQSEDEQNEQQQKLRERYEKVNFGRQQIIKYLPRANFDLDRAIRENQKYNYDLGIGLEDYNNWYEGVKTSFTKNPVTVLNPGGATERGFEKVFDSFFSRYFKQTFLRKSGMLKDLENPVAYKRNLKSGAKLGRGKGVETGYRWIANVKVIK